MSRRLASVEEMRLKSRIYWIGLGIMLAIFIYAAFDHRSMSHQLAVEAANTQAQSDRAERLILSSPIAQVMCGPTGKITVFNPAAEQLTGYSASEMLGGNIERILPKSVRKSHHESFAGSADRLRAKGGNWQVTGEVEGQVYHATGKLLPVIVRVRGIIYGDTVEFIAAIRATESLCSPSQIEPFVPPVLNRNIAP